MGMTLEEYYKSIQYRQELERLTNKKLYKHRFEIDESIKAARRTSNGYLGIRRCSMSNIYDSYNESKICDEW